MNVSLNPYHRQSGPTGSVHRISGAGISSSGESMMASNSSASDQKKWGDTTSRSGEISRIFVAPIDYKSASCLEIEQRFGNYGNIRGIDINQKNFAFVQFERIEEAQNACHCENGSNYGNKKIEVRLFDKSGHPTKGRPKNGNPNRDRSRSPQRGPMGNRPPMGGPTGTRHGSMIANMNQYMGDDYPPYQAPPPMPSTEPVVGNEIEIIVVSKEQWGYADMIEKRIKQESGIRFIDMLFLHSPASLNLTLNDLFARQTLYALVVAPVNEEHMSVTLHVLHNQTEHRNMPLEDAIQLINNDFRAFNESGGVGPTGPMPIGSGNASNASRMGATDQSYRTPNAGSMPEEVSYLLKTVLEENGPQFLSLTQLDILIDYFQRQKNRMTGEITGVSQVKSGAYGGGSGGDQKPNAVDLEKQKATLLDNPHVQAALSSLIQIGALTSNPSSSGSNISPINQSNSRSNALFGGFAYGNQSQNNGSIGQTTRRHPLLGTEVKPSISGAPGGLVEYPPVQSYNQYHNYQY